MIKIIAESIILMLLFTGMLSDIKTRRVSNKISGLIAIVSLLSFDLSLWQAKLALFLLTIAFFYIGLKYNKTLIGGADVKVLAPVSFTLTAIGFNIFLLSVAIFSLATSLIMKKRHIPGFLPIALSYMVVLAFISI